MARVHARCMRACCSTSAARLGRAWCRTSRRWRCRPAPLSHANYSSCIEPFEQCSATAGSSRGSPVQFSKRPHLQSTRRASSRAVESDVGCAARSAASRHQQAGHAAASFCRPETADAKSSCTVSNKRQVHHPTDCAARAQTCCGGGRQVGRRWAPLRSRVARAAAQELIEQITVGEVCRARNTADGGLAAEPHFEAARLRRTAAAGHDPCAALRSAAMTGEHDVPAAFSRPTPGECS